MNFGALATDIDWRVWGTPANFSGFCIGTLYIHFWGLLHPNGILPTAKFTLHPSLAFCYIGSVNARHSSSGHQPNFAMWYKEWNYGTHTEDTTYIRLGSHHVGHRPTFLVCFTMPVLINLPLRFLADLV